MRGVVGKHCLRVQASSYAPRRRHRAAAGKAVPAKPAVPGSGNSTTGSAALIAQVAGDKVGLANGTLGLPSGLRTVPLRCTRHKPEK
jgi:hypothetical protein